jgi:hypothetical protein
LSYISRAADLGHEAASTVVKRLYDAPSAAFPKNLILKLEYLFKESALAVSLINIQDSDGQSPVIAACKYGHFEVFTIFLEHEASVALNHWVHESCLHWVSSFQSAEQIEWAVSELGARGADLGSCIPFVGSRYYEFYCPRTRRGCISPFLAVVQCNSVKALAALFSPLPRSSWVAAFDHHALGVPSTDNWTAD